MQKIKFKIRQNYGKTLVYPDCIEAEIFAEMVGNKTLSAKHLQQIHFLGFNIFITGLSEKDNKHFQDTHWEFFQHFLDQY